MSLAARSMSAVSSTTTGGLPGPAQMAFLPLPIASRTTPGPPVTTSRSMPGCLISSWAEAMVGSATVVTILGGPPELATARLIRSQVRTETALARGWGLKTTLFPAAIIPMPLQRIVSVGLVTGVMEPMTP